MITPENLVPELNNTITELLLIRARLEGFMDDPDITLRDIERVERDFSDAMEPVTDMIDVVAITKPHPSVIGDRLAKCFIIPTEILNLLIELRKRTY